MNTSQLRHIRTARLDVAYEESGPRGGASVVLLHDWPYDPRCYDGVVPLLVAAECRVLVPYLRGFGPPRFLSAETPRSGQQAALGHDLLEMMDVLAVERAILAGYDWGGRAACIVSALWPERVRGLVTVNGYNIQDIAGSGEPQDPAQERRYWYQWYFHTERGRAALELDRRAFCRLLWQLWSPNWNFDEATFSRSATSFDNPDFVDVTPSTLTGTAAATPRAIRRWRRSKSGSPLSRKSQCRPLRCRAPPMASCRRNYPKRMARFSPGRISTAFSQKSGIIPRKKRPPSSPKPYSNWSALLKPSHRPKYSKCLFTIATFAAMNVSSLNLPLPAVPKLRPDR
jgi:pimeloyl-ACP methyl ester carboxylesterase